jgi:hypothetical protein
VSKNLVSWIVNKHLAMTLGVLESDKSIRSKLPLLKMKGILVNCGNLKVTEAMVN